jgi:probable rRNA maturation factor
VSVDVEVEARAWTELLPDAEALARAAAEAALHGSDGPQDVSVLLADDGAVQELNARFRGKDAPTNVLSFPAAPSAAPHLGDVALAWGVCAREAQAQGKPLAHHLQHLVVHGVLHLLGFDHEAEREAEEMEALERVVLARLGVDDPYRSDADAG